MNKVIKYVSSDQSGLKFLSKDGEEQVVHLEPHFMANNGDSLRLLAESHHGITYLPSSIMWPSSADLTIAHSLLF